MSGREYLEGSILLCRKGDLAKKRFTILEIVGEGSTNVSYEACYEESEKGILKEFYPLDVAGRYYALERDENRQLVSTEGFVKAYENFQQAKKEYVEPYYTLLAAKRNPDSEEALSSFIMPFEIYYGCDEELNEVGSIYIWTPEKKVVSFEKVCEEIRRHPEKDSEQQLFLVLNIIEKLSDCVCSLHLSELLHRDIKPSNFGFREQSLVVFDIDSICSVYHPPTVPIGTEGFCAPEAETGEIDNRTDIYSIGATLFYALVNEKKFYKDEYYDSIEELLRRSELLAHLEERKEFVHILKKCLHPMREMRYLGCEELLRDLRKIKIRK